MIADSLYMTSVRVEAAREAEWDTFYDGWTRAFATEVPGCCRGSRWRVVDGLAAGAERLPPAGLPTFQAIFEHASIDRFTVSRSYRGTLEWRPRAAAFDPWFRVLTDYATLHLQRIGPPPRAAAELAPFMLQTLWTIDQYQAIAFEERYVSEILPALAERLHAGAAHHYLATLAHLHRYGDENGKLVIPLRLHFEERGSRLCYSTLFELPRLPDPAERAAAIGWLGERLASLEPSIGDRHEAFSERILVEGGDA